MSQVRNAQLRETAQDYYRQATLACKTSDDQAISQFTNAITTLDVISKSVRTEEDYYWQAVAYKEIVCACIRKQDGSSALENLDHARSRLSKCVSKIPEEKRTDKHYDILLFCDVVKWAVIMMKRKQNNLFQLFGPTEVTDNLLKEFEENLQQCKKILNADNHAKVKSAEMSSSHLLFNRMNTQHDNEYSEKESNTCPKAVI